MTTAVRTAALATVLSVIPVASHAGVFVSIGIGAPPVLPVYAQPVCPAPGYIWTPGYWAYNEDGGYYWVPGAWVLAPYSGALWTPGYWGYGPTGYLWHAGYWGTHIGFYGGVNYGFGYFGHGYEGGYWNHGVFAYNRSVTNVNIVNVRNVYNRTVVNNNASRVSFNGGRGGIQMRPTAEEQRFGQEQHMAPIAAQQQNAMRAGQNRAQFASVNHGRPADAARMQPATFNRSMANDNMSRGNMATQNHGNFAASANNNRAMTNNNAGRPAFNNNIQRPAATNQSFNRGTQQTYRPQTNQNFNRGQQQTYRPQQFHSAPQQSRPQEPRGNGGEGHGGGGGHKR